MTYRFPSEKELEQALNQLSKEDIAKTRADLKKDAIKSQTQEIELQKRMEQTTQEIINTIPTIYSEYIIKQTDNYIEVNMPVGLDNYLGFTTVYRQAGREIFTKLDLDIGYLPKCWEVTPSLVAVGVNKNSLDDKLVYKITLTNKNNNYKVSFDFNLTNSFSEMLANINNLRENWRIINVKEARELQNIGELNKAVDKAERYIDNCIKHSAVTKGIVEFCLYDEYYPKDTTYEVKDIVYYTIPDGTLGQIIQGHWLCEEHSEEFHKRILDMYDKAGYRVSYKMQKVGKDIHTYVFEINGFKNER